MAIFNSQLLVYQRVCFFVCLFVCLFSPRSHEVWTNLTSPLKSFKYLYCRGFQLVGMNTFYGNFPKNPWASEESAQFIPGG